MAPTRKAGRETVRGQNEVFFLNLSDAVISGGHRVPVGAGWK